MMRLTIERLRAGVLAGTLLLLTTLGGVLLYAHHRAHGLLRDLPSRLGVDIEKETNGVTFSKTIAGRALFTVHAAKATQRKDGQAELEDAGIVLYGDGNGRADRIYGKSFHYDQAAGVVRAMGVVQLDLQAPAPVTAQDRLRFASGGAMQAGDAAAAGGDVQQPVHVTTSDLVYSQQTGMASTPEPLHFEFRDMVGDARGASYNARTGFTVLQSDIRMSGTDGGRAFHLTAQHGELDRAANQLVLRAALLEGGPGGAGGQRLSAAVLVLHLGAGDRTGGGSAGGLGGGIARAEGSGGVAIADGGSSARAPIADMTFRAGSQPEQVRLRGGVQFLREAAKSGAVKISGSAGESVGHFDGSGKLSTLLLSHDAVVEAMSPTDASDRALSGDEVLLEFANTAGAGREWVRQVTANGKAHLRLTRSGAGAVGGDSLAADRLQARLRLEPTGEAGLDTVTGRGHVVLHRSGAGLEETSLAEAIDASFSGGGAAGDGRADQRGPHLLAAVARGGVTLDRSARKPDGTTESLHGSAREARYDGVSDRASLEGDAVLAQATGTVRADRVVMANASGDADAYGGVQATITPVDRAGGAAGNGSAPARSSLPMEPVHAVAAHAMFKNAEQMVTLFGEAGQVARIWRGGSQVEAPLLVLRQQAGTLDASGGTGAGVAMVRTVLAEDQAKPAADEAGSKATVGRVVRVASERLHYSDVARQAEFTGAVVLRDGDGVIHARRAVATIRERGPQAEAGRGVAAPAGSARRGGGVLPGGALQRVVADGGVTLEQPGRSASGQQVVYTASDGLFVLTGTPAVPPVVVDRVTGSLTGAVLRFHAGDNSVAVDGSVSPGKPGRVHTELRLKQ